MRVIRLHVCAHLALALSMTCSVTFTAKAASPEPAYKYYRLETGVASAVAINCRGEIAGGETIAGRPTRRVNAFYYYRGGLTVLPDEFSVAGILDNGVVVGTNYAVRPYVGANWYQGSLTSLDTPPWTEFAGVTPAPALVGSTSGDYGTLPFYRDLDGDHVLPAVGCEPCGADGWVWDGNENGVMVGFGDDGETFTGRRPLIYRNGIYSYLPHQAGVVTIEHGYALAINDVETIVGFVGDGQRWPQPDYAVAWIDELPVALSVTSDSYAHDVSNAGASAWDYFDQGIIVGEVNGQATMWCTPCFGGACEVSDPSGSWVSYNLNSLLVNEEPVETLIAAYAINDCGMIVGRGLTSSFLLVPADSTDTDSDGLLDLWEKCGIDGDDDGFVDLILTGADPETKDLYLEVDVMSGVNPQFDALQDVASAFAAQDIELHFIGDWDPVSDSYSMPAFDDSDLPAADFVLDSLDEVAALRCSYFGSASERAIEDESIRNARLKAKSMAVRYVVVGQSHTVSDSSSYAGMAEFGGNIFSVTLAASAGSVDERHQYSSTIMHELGHTLGLDHSGPAYDEEIPDRFNFKPNYPSVMNYTWSLPIQVDASLDLETKQALQRWRDSWRLEYSNGTMNDIDEHSIPSLVNLGGDFDRFVPVGLIRPAEGEEVGTVRMVRMGGSWDWFPGIAGSVSDVNANYISSAWATSSASISIGSIDVLEDHDDWTVVNQNLLPWRTWSLHPFASDCAGLARDPASNGRYVPRELTIAEFLALGRIQFDCNRNGISDGEDIRSGTSVDVDGNGIPDECEEIVPTSSTPGPRLQGMLEVNPNPFNPRTEITFSAAVGSRVIVSAFDAMGRRVDSLFDGPASGSEQRIAWDASELPSGVYFVRLEGDSGAITRKVTLLK